MFVVFDLDGTLALNEHRVHYIREEPRDYDAFYAACTNDVPNAVVTAVFQAHVSAGNHVEIWSGRSDQVREETEHWLRKRAGISSYRLKRMRRAADHRPDVVLKREWLSEARAAGRAPDLVYDDRDCVVAMWREEGVPCFQVAPGLDGQDFRDDAVTYEIIHLDGRRERVRLDRRSG